jgi:hypothetical protein
MQLLANGADIRHLDGMHARAGLVAFDEFRGLLQALHQILAEFVHLALLSPARRA